MRFPIWRRRREKELDEEIKSHLRMAIEDRIARGEPREQAEASAQREMGNLGLVKEVTREMWGGMWLERLWQDLRYAGMTLARRPGFTIVAVMTLALGIGSNTAVFSVINGVMLQPLPFRNPEQLLNIQTVLPTSATNNIRGVTYSDYIDWRAKNRVFESLSAFISSTATITSDGEPELLNVSQVDSGLFHLLQVDPMLGRQFQAGEDSYGAGNFAILSYELWNGHFGGDPSVIGRMITLERTPYRVIGVMPAKFAFPDKTQVWINLQVKPAFQGRTFSFYSVIARLKPGMNLVQAQTDMAAIAAGLAEAFSDTNKDRKVIVNGLQAEAIKQVRPALLILGGAAFFVMLIACANVANLLLTRAVERQRGIAIRTALGASRSRLILQLLTESLLLSSLGGIAGVMLSVWVTNAVVKLSPVDIPSREQIRINGVVLGFSLVMSLAAGVIAGLSPIMTVLSVDFNDALKQAGNRLASSLKQRRLRSSIIIVELSLTLILLVSAGLLVRSFHSIVTTRLGYVPENLLTLNIELPSLKYPDAAACNSFFTGLEERLKGVAGIKSVGYTFRLPQESTFRSNAQIKASDGNEADQTEAVSINSISPDYLTAIGVQLLAGRTFTSSDTGKSKKVVIIDQALARRFWPNQNSIGKQLYYSNGPWEVVGVVGGTRQLGLTSKETLQIFLPFSQFAANSGRLVVRREGDASAIIPALRTVVRQVDKDLPLQNIVLMEDRLSAAATGPKFYSVLMGSFSAIAILLALIGLYGVISHSVSQRTQEVGIRIALGAQSRDILNLVIRQGLRITVIGLVIGAAGALAGTRLLNGLLFGITPTDPVTFAGIAGLLLAVALLACYIPARRATRVDPMVALRYE